MGSITIAGLGPGDKSFLTLSVMDALNNHNDIYLRTIKHPTVAYLQDRGISFKAFDYAYDEKNSFDEVYQHICNTLLQEGKRKDVLYVVPGHPRVAEYTVELLIKECKSRQIPVEVIPAMSFLDVMLPAVGLDPVAGFKLIDALQLHHQEPDPEVANIITQIYDPFVASEVKLKLMEYYHHLQPLVVVRGAAIAQMEKIQEIQLYQLDRIDWVDHLTSVYIPKASPHQKKYYKMNNLVDIMEILRHKDGCPWDIQQTHNSLKPYLIEEAYEVLDAIEKEDDILLEEELGDLLLQVVFHSQIAKERGSFTIKEVIAGICEKLVYRHPHVFKDAIAPDSQAAIESWEDRKSQEKPITSHTEAMQSIPKTLPALVRADKLQKKAAKVGFDWDNPQDILNKIVEEMNELQEAYKKGNLENIEEEGGDLLFAVVNLLRFYKIDAENALRGTISKFLHRFSYIEEMAKREGKKLENMTLAEMDILWENSKIFKTKAPKY